MFPERFSGTFGYNSNEKFIVDLPSLKEVILGRRSFRNASNITFSSSFLKRLLRIDLPSLQSIRLGMSAMKGATKSSVLVMRSRFSIGMSHRSSRTAQN